jgi:hypothetical protein
MSVAVFRAILVMFLAISLTSVFINVRTVSNETNPTVLINPNQQSSFSLSATNPENFVVSERAVAYPEDKTCESFQWTGGPGCPQLLPNTRWLPSDWIYPAAVYFGQLAHDEQKTIENAFKLEIPANATIGDYSLGLGWTWYGQGGNSPPYDHRLASQVWIVRVTNEELPVQLKTDSARYKVWGYIGQQVTIEADDRFSWKFELTPTENYHTDSFFIMLLNGRSANGMEGPVWFEIYLNGAKVSAQIVYLHATGPRSLIMDINDFIQPYTSYTLQIVNTGKISAYFESIEFLAMTCTTTVACG